MAERTRTTYTQELTKYFRNFDKLKERLGRPPTAKELGPLPYPGEEDIYDSRRFRINFSSWRGARVEPKPTTYKVRY